MRKIIEDAWFEWFNNQAENFTDQEPEVISKQAFKAGYEAAEQSVYPTGGMCPDHPDTELIVYCPVEGCKQPTSG